MYIPCLCTIALIQQPQQSPPLTILWDFWGPHQECWAGLGFPPKHHHLETPGFSFAHSLTSLPLLNHHCQNSPSHQGQLRRCRLMLLIRGSWSVAKPPWRSCNLSRTPSMLFLKRSLAVRSWRRFCSQPVMRIYWPRMRWRQHNRAQWRARRHGYPQKMQALNQSRI